MQYSVPQFIEVEDQILPHLSIKQFLMVLFGGILGLIYWAIFGIGIIFFFLLVLTFLIILPITFFKFNGRSLLANVPNLMRFITAPRYRIFSRQGGDHAVLKQEVVAQQKSQKPEEAQVTSRLKNLAYLLDAKAAEEERLLRVRE